MLKDFHLAALPVISVAVAAGYLSSLGEVRHCVQVHDARACEVLVATLPDSLPENAPVNPMQAKQLIAVAGTTSVAPPGGYFPIVQK